MTPSKPRPRGFVLVCPEHGHTLAHVTAHPGTGWPAAPDTLDDGACSIHPALDHRLVTLCASRPETITPLTDLPATLGVPRLTVRALVAAGLPSTGHGVRLADLAAWTRTARGNPNPEGTGWQWTCWPCLRTGVPYASADPHQATASGTLPVRALVNVAAAHLANAPERPGTVPATRPGLNAARRTLGVAPETLDAAHAYLSARLELHARPPASQLLRALAWREPFNPDAPNRVAAPPPASLRIRPDSDR